jgi:cytochrome P450
MLAIAKRVSQERYFSPGAVYFTVFGKGARACLGRSLATMELKLATAALITKYNVELRSPTADEDMEMACHFVLVPKGKRFILRFTQAS